MSWTADQIYTLPNPEIIACLKSIPDVEKRLFLVDDLEGIRSDWTRSFMLSNEPRENGYRRHGLPKGGLLTIAPKVYKTGYDKDNSTSEFWTTNSDRRSEKWSHVASTYEEFQGLSSSLGLNSNQRKLFTLLEWLNTETKVPIVYYKCEMWAGSIDEEFSIVFDNTVFVYQWDIDNKKPLELRGETVLNSELTPLQKGLDYLGMPLPTWFFALHEGSFDWKRYQIH